VKTVVAVRDLGRSADQQAEQLQVLSNVGGGDETGVTNLVNGLRAQIAKAGPPAGLQVHLAGQLAISVDQQTKSGSTGNQVEGLSVIFILVLLLLIFRSLLAPLITLVPAFLAVAISGPLVAEAAHAGLKVSQLAQLMLIVLVLGAGTDYGLFLVFRVRETCARGPTRTTRCARRSPGPARQSPSPPSPSSPRCSRCWWLPSRSTPSSASRWPSGSAPCCWPA
jgi:RND superfamily putative drug exporter